MLAIALFISGAGVAPLIVAGYNVAEKICPSRKSYRNSLLGNCWLSFGGALPGTFDGAYY